MTAVLWSLLFGGPKSLGAENTNLDFETETILVHEKIFLNEEIESLKNNDRPFILISSDSKRIILAKSNKPNPIFSWFSMNLIACGKINNVPVYFNNKLDDKGLLILLVSYIKEANKDDIKVTQPRARTHLHHAGDLGIKLLDDFDMKQYKV